jgi:hypothetical protein
MSPDEIKRRFVELGWTRQLADMSSLAILGVSEVLGDDDVIESAAPQKTVMLGNW